MFSGPEIGDVRRGAAKLLGVSPDASADEISDAFRRAVTQHHPDVGGSAEQTQRILEARDVLLAPSAAFVGDAPLRRSRAFTKRPRFR